MFVCRQTPYIHPFKQTNKQKQKQKQKLKTYQKHNADNRLQS